MQAVSELCAKNRSGHFRGGQRGDSQEDGSSNETSGAGADRKGGRVRVLEKRLC